MARGGSDREPCPGAGGSPEDGARLPDARPLAAPAGEPEKRFRFSNAPQDRDFTAFPVPATGAVDNYI